MGQYSRKNAIKGTGNTEYTDYPRICTEGFIVYLAIFMAIVTSAFSTYTVVSTVKSSLYINYTPLCDPVDFSVFRVTRNPYIAFFYFLYPYIY